MPLSDTEFRQLVTILESPLRDRSQREHLLGMAFPNDPAKRNYAMDILDPAEFAHKVVERLYHKDRPCADLIVLLQVIQEDWGGDLSLTLQPYIERLKGDQSLIAPENTQGLPTQNPNISTQKITSISDNDVKQALRNMRTRPYFLDGTNINLDADLEEVNSITFEIGFDWKWVNEHFKSPPSFADYLEENLPSVLHCGVTIEISENTEYDRLFVITLELYDID